MVLARATQAAITFADAIQVKDLGKGAIAATATGGLNIAGIAILPMGTVFILQSFVSQLVGRNARDEAPRFAWYGLAIALGAGLISLALIPVIGPVMQLTGFSDHVRDQMTSYMDIRITSIGAIVGVEALGAYYGGLGNTWMQMVASLVTMTVAIVLNWILIGGHLGAPAMGVDGAALASTIASWTGFVVIAVAWRRGWGGAPRPTGRSGLSIRELRRVIEFGLPNGINWVLEFAAFQVFINIVLARLGDDAVAALNVVIAVNSVAFMPAWGLASAGAILAGQAIGRGARDDVWPSVRISLVCTMSWMCAIGALYLAFPDRVLAIFAPDTDAGRIVEIGTSMLVMSSLWQVFDAVGITLSETLRAAGDTAWTAKVRIILAWFVFTPTAYATVSQGGGPVGAMLCMIGYLAVIAFALSMRFRSGAWRSIELIEPQLA